MKCSFPEDAFRTVIIFSDYIPDLIPIIIPPQGLRVYLCGVPLRSARANDPKA